MANLIIETYIITKKCEVRFEISITAKNILIIMID
jgi:hypothetical protein